MAESASTTVGHRVPRWLPWVGTLLTLAGIAVSGYLTYAHYTTPAVLSCPETALINCTKVTTSAYSEILGVPLALLGLLFFVTMLPVQLPWAWRRPEKWLQLCRLVFASSGILMIFWLIYVEFFLLNAICLYCSAVHLITLLLFGLTALGTALTSE